MMAKKILQMSLCSGVSRDVRSSLECDRNQKLERAVKSSRSSSSRARTTYEAVKGMMVVGLS